MGGKGFGAGKAAEFTQSPIWVLVEELKFDLETDNVAWMRP